ncbi:MAG TPA: carbamoyl phosphate synthase large subunit, partial [Ignavibacteria bacterium]|nr:carbamoyl phosphate synthase large subunit [Ignavibacteria bacterium]
NEAFLKSILSIGLGIPTKAVMLSTGSLKQKALLLPVTKKLYELGLKFYATKGTADFLKANGMEATVLHWPLEKKEPNVLTYLNEGKIDLVINIPKGTDLKEIKSDYMIRRKSIDLNINLINNVQVADRFVKALSRYKEDELPIKSWDEYN